MALEDSAEDNALIPIPRSAVEALLRSLSSSLATAPPQAPTPFDPVEFLAEFSRACQVDYRLAPLTIREYMRHVQGLLIFLDKHPLQATRPELRRFFMVNTSHNAVKALRVLYGRFLGSDLAKCFKVPQYVPRVVVVPTKEQLQLTYENLNTLELKAAFLLLATSGLRRHELLELKPTQIDLDKCMIVPDGGHAPTKIQGLTFFNDEAKAPLTRLLSSKPLGPDGRIFWQRNNPLRRGFERASVGFPITPKVLRYWFCNEMGRLGVQDRYIDAFCGRLPRSVLARHYTDYSPDRLKQIYDKAGLKVLGG